MSRGKYAHKASAAFPNNRSNSRVELFIIAETANAPLPNSSTWRPEFAQRPFHRRSLHPLHRAIAPHIPQ
jgi:hypothetical protein